MFVDAREVAEGTTLRSVVCIVGGGVAGITLALEFERQGIDAILLESGGLVADDETRDLNRGENIGLRFAWADGARSRFLGGSSNCWGGWCGPLRAHEMQTREWIPDSGWPFERSSLDPYYERAHPILRLGPYNYDIKHWVSAIDRKDVRRIPLPTGRVHDILSQFSSPSRLGDVYHDDLKRSQHVRICLHANVVDIETDPGATTARRVHVRTLTGRRFTVEARQFVLACGGIENARLLLASNKAQAAGLGNANDLVGRYFADHPRVHVGNVRFRPQWKRNKLYDIKFHFLNRAVSANGTYVSSQFSLDPKLQEREGLLNSQLWFASVFPGDGTDEAEAVIRMKHRLHAKADPDYTLLGDLSLLARHPINTSSFVLARLLQPEALIKEIKITVICEPAPDRNSRVTLSDQRDALGVPRIRMDWRLGDQVKRTVDRSLAVFADELRVAEVADVDLPPPIEGGEWPYTRGTPTDNLGTWHHMSTTRMNDSPRRGVVDRDCRIHGMSNLYAAGSSVFPTCGANFPTITICALSLRLADHLAGQLRLTEAELPGHSAPAAELSQTA
ncbi:FAD-dependent oxidoreductase [Methylibium sp.]|uniref:FAD-dependent oxidoreductase n=1 Tax=Methylibium sp. TaxID=2067992 RepID=UPI003D12D072